MIDFSDSSFVDKPEEWRRCFGLDDNPFSPAHDRGGLNLSNLDIEIEALCPQRVGYELLYKDFFVREVDNIQKSWNQFVEYFKILGPRLFRNPPLMLIHGPRGSGKATFSNVCRHVLVDKLRDSKRIILCERSLSDPQRGFLLEDDIVKGLRDEIAKEIPQKNVRKAAMALILLRHFSEEFLNENDTELPATFLFLSRVRAMLCEDFIPVLFVTTSSEEVVRTFSNRPRGDGTESKSFALSELSGNDVVKFIATRVGIFRVNAKATPDRMPLFPFHERAVIDSFKNLTRQGFGSLPFRSVNRILAGALRLKKQKLMTQHAPAEYGPDLEEPELLRRLIDKESLDSAIKGHFT